MARSRFQTVIILLFIFVMGVSSPHAGTLRLSIAASMTDVFKALITQFSTRHPEVRILPNFGPSGGLAKQIYYGAPVDFYVSANPKWAQYLEEYGKIAPSSLKIFAENSLVFVSKESRITSMEELAGLQRIGIGNPKNVPAGHYAKQTLDSIFLYGQLLKKGKLIMAKDVRQALLYADRGETDGSFVYATDSRLTPKCRILFEVPAELHDPIRYPLALTAQGMKSAEALLFYDFVLSEEGQEILSDFGFTVPQPDITVASHDTTVSTGY